MPKVVKEAIVLIFDVGHTDKNSEFFQSSKECLKMILQRKMFSESKDDIALILVGTPTTDNPLHTKELYRNISVLRHLERVDWEIFNTIESLTPSSSNGDWLESIIVALDLLKVETKENSHLSSNVLLATNCSSQVNNNMLERVSKSITDMGVDFSIMTSDEFEKVEEAIGSMEIQKMQKTVKDIAKKLVEGVEGQIFTFSDIIPHLMHFSKKTVNPNPWNVDLELTPDVHIPISGYIKAKESTIKSWKTCYAQNERVPINKERIYQKSDINLTSLDHSKVIQGYKYGKTIVPFNSEDVEGLTYKSGERGLTILGFTSTSNVKFHQHIGDSVLFILPRTGNEGSVHSLNVLIQALYEMNMVAIARRVYSRNSAPSLGALYPRIKEKEQCLMWLALPFMEDMRYFSFPSLHKNKKLEPTADENQCVNDLIDRLDLTSESLNGVEKFDSLKETLNPHHQYIFQCLLQRAMDPGSKLSPVKEHLLCPTKSLFPNMPPNIGSDITELFGLVRCPKYVQGDSLTSDIEMKLAENDEPGDTFVTKQDLLDVFDNTQEITTANPVESFMAIIRRDSTKFEKACKDLQSVVEKLLTQSYHGDQDDKMMKSIRALRQECLLQHECHGFNSWMLQFKDMAISRDRKDLLQKLVQDGIGLLSKEDDGESAYSEKDSISLLCSEDTPAMVQALPDQDDLLDEL